MKRLDAFLNTAEEAIAGNENALSQLNEYARKEGQSEQQPKLITVFMHGEEVLGVCRGLVSAGEKWYINLGFYERNIEFKVVSQRDEEENGKITRIMQLSER